MALNLKTVLAEVFDEFGGVREFAKKVVADYNASQPGSAQRARLACSIVALLSKIEDDTIEDFDPERARRRVADILRQLQSQTANESQTESIFSTPQDPGSGR